MANTPAIPVKAVLWDFGGVLTTSPFDAFNAYEAANGLEPGFIRRLNATNPDANAWARFERAEIAAEEFAVLFEAEAAAAGGRVETAAILAAIGGELRPQMVRAVARCHEHVRTGLLTNNFVSGRAEVDNGAAQPSLYRQVMDMFDVVVESSTAGCRKPDSRFYQMACEMLAIEPAEAIFLDDLGINLKPARLMGMRTIKVVDPDAALAELQEHLDFPLV